MRNNRNCVPEKLLKDGEMEVLQLVYRGFKNTDIAKELVIGESTVEYRLGKVFVKLGVGNRTQAVVKGLEVGLLGHGERGNDTQRPSRESA